MTDSELEDKPQVNLKEVSAIPDMVNWSLRTGNPEDLIAGHFSALTSYCFFAQDIEILEEIEKFYDYFLKLVQDPDESHSQDYADII